MSFFYMFIFNYNLNLAMQKLSFDINKPINFLLFYIRNLTIVILLCLETPNTVIIT